MFFCLVRNVSERKGSETIIICLFLHFKITESKKAISGAKMDSNKIDALISHSDFLSFREINSMEINGERLNRIHHSKDWKVLYVEMCPLYSSHLSATQVKPLPRKTQFDPGQQLSLIAAPTRPPRKRQVSPSPTHLSRLAPEVGPCYSQLLIYQTILVLNMKILTISKNIFHLFLVLA